MSLTSANGFGDLPTGYGSFALVPTCDGPETAWRPAPLVAQGPIPRRFRRGSGMRAGGRSCLGGTGPGAHLRSARSRRRNNARTGCAETRPQSTSRTHGAERRWPTWARSPTLVGFHALVRPGCRPPAGGGLSATAPRKGGSTGNRCVSIPDGGRARDRECRRRTRCPGQ